MCVARFWVLVGRFRGRGVCLGVNCAEIAVPGNCTENFEVILVDFDVGGILTRSVDVFLRCQGKLLLRRESIRVDRC